MAAAAFSGWDSPLAAPTSGELPKLRLLLKSRLVRVLLGYVGVYRRGVGIPKITGAIWVSPEIEVFLGLYLGLPIINGNYQVSVSEW